MSNENRTRKWRAHLQSGSALIATTPKTDRYVTVTVFYVSREGNTDTKWFLIAPETVLPTATAWIEKNLGPIQHLVEEPVEIEEPR